MPNDNSELKAIVKEALKEVIAEQEAKDSKIDPKMPLGDWAFCRHCKKPIGTDEYFVIHHSACLLKSWQTQVKIAK